MKSRDTDGDSSWLETERRRVFGAVYGLDKRMSEEDMSGFKVHQVTLQSPTHTGSNWRAIVKGSEQGGPTLVSFCNAESAPDLIKAIAAGLEEGFLKWREDKPFNAPTS